MDGSADQSPTHDGNGPGLPKGHGAPVETSAVVFGITLEMLSDGQLRVTTSASSPRQANVHDVEYLLDRAARENLVQRVAEAVCNRQIALAKQARAQQVMQQAMQLQREAQQEAAGSR